MAKLTSMMVLLLLHSVKAMLIRQHIDSSVQGVRLLSLRKTSQAPKPTSETQTR